MDEVLHRKSKRIRVNRHCHEKDSPLTLTQAAGPRTVDLPGSVCEFELLQKVWSETRVLLQNIFHLGIINRLDLLFVDKLFLHARVFYPLKPADVNTERILGLG